MFIINYYVYLYLKSTHSDENKNKWDNPKIIVKPSLTKHDYTLNNVGYMPTLSYHLRCPVKRKPIYTIEIFIHYTPPKT